MKITIGDKYLITNDNYNFFFQVKTDPEITAKLYPEKEKKDRYQTLAYCHDLDSVAESILEYTIFNSEAKSIKELHDKIVKITAELAKSIKKVV